MRATFFGILVRFDCLGLNSCAKRDRKLGFHCLVSGFGFLKLKYSGDEKEKKNYGKNIQGFLCDGNVFVIGVGIHFQRSI